MTDVHRCEEQSAALSALYKGKRDKAVCDLSAQSRRSGAVPDPDIVLQPLPQGRPGTIKVDLMRDGQSLSTCVIVPVTIRVGVATVLVNGIGEVGTALEHRERGYARRVLRTAIAHMAAGDAALSMLFGIPGFYPRFGYATAGPQYTLSLPCAEPAPRLLPGWQVRAATHADLPAIQRLYDHDTAHAVGAVVRPPHGYPWTKLADRQPVDLAADCRVVTAPQGGVVAYAWRDRDSWFTEHVGDDHPNSLVLAEVVAQDAPAADAVLAACQAWAHEEGQGSGHPLTAVTLAIPPDGPVVAAARYGAATLQHAYSADGECMVRTLHPGRLLASLAPELERRLQATLPGFRATVILVTEVGSVALRASPAGLHIEAGNANPPAEAHLVRLPQTVLARVALGAFCPADLLARLETPPSEVARDLLAALFPPRHPHMSIPDRF